MKFREISCDGVDSVELTPCSQMMKFFLMKCCFPEKADFPLSLEEFSPSGATVVHRFNLVVQCALSGRVFFAVLMYTGKMERISATCRILTSILRVQKPTFLP
jgi:hypothetical protein